MSLVKTSLATASPSVLLVHQYLTNDSARADRRVTRFKERKDSPPRYTSVTSAEGTFKDQAVAGSSDNITKRSTFKRLVETASVTSRRRSVALQLSVVHLAGSGGQSKDRAHSSTRQINTKPALAPVDAHPVCQPARQRRLAGRRGGLDGLHGTTGAGDAQTDPVPWSPRVLSRCPKNVAESSVSVRWPLCGVFPSGFRGTSFTRPGAES